MRDSRRKLDAHERLLLHGKLCGLYGYDNSDAKVFDWLDLDKQQALLLLALRLDALDVWRFVRCITNVYGAGGVGCEFVAASRLELSIAARKEFTSRFARHADVEAGYLERRRPRGSLHLLLMNRATCLWSAHFDAYSPVASPLSACLHLWHERLRKRHPAWHDLGSLNPTSDVSAEKQK